MNDRIVAVVSNPKQETEKFVCEYYHDSSKWQQTIDAYDFEDAQVRAKKLSMTLLGKQLVQAPGVIKWLVLFYCRIRNFLFPYDKILKKKKG